LNMANMNMNSASPIQIQPQSSQSSTVSMPTSNSFNGPIQIRRVSSHPITRKEDGAGNDKEKSGDMKNEQSDGVKRIVLASSPRASIGGDQQMKAISPRVGDSAKAALNAGAAPFMIYSGNQVSPPVSPRNFNTPGFVVPPPPPQFQFPPPPLPQNSWLPLPPSTNQTHNNGMTVNMSSAQPQPQGLMVNTNMTPINMGNTNFTPKEQAVNMIVNNNRSPMFTPTHSPPFQSQPFQPFSH